MYTVNGLMQQSASNQNLQLQQSLTSSSHNNTFDKLQYLKPLRETQNQQRIKQQSAVMPRQTRDKTPTRAMNKLSSEQQQQSRRQTIDQQQKPNKSQVRSGKQQITPYSQTLNINSNTKSQLTLNPVQMKDFVNLKSSCIDKTPSKSGLQFDNYKSNEIKTPNRNGKSMERLLLQSQLNQSKERIKKPLIKAQDEEFVNLNVYVVKNKRSQKSQLQSQQNQNDIQKREKSATPTSQQHNQQSKKHNFNLDKSQKLTKEEQMLRTALSKRDDSRSKYSGVQSKVKQMLRSKTPQGRGAVLTQQQYMDQQDRQNRREQEIHQLENEIYQIQHDLQFKQNNKDLVLETYKARQQYKKGTNTDYDQSSSDRQDTLHDSTDESSSRVNLQSKKQFGSYEQQVQNHNFTDKYFDKVYLELCGFSDISSGQTQHLEKQKSTFEVKQHKTPSVCNQNPMLSPRVIQDIDLQDIVGSITFFERRCDQQKAQIHGVVNLDSAYNSRTDSQQDQQQYDEDALQESPTQIRRVDDFDREEFMNARSIDREEFDHNFGNEDQRKKREEMRAENKKLVEDFDNVLNDLISQRKTASHMAFYEAINEYNYDKKQLDSAIYKDPNGSFQVAQSPTKRLICMKNSSIEHFKHIRERNLVDRSGEKQNMIYMASPERSYVVKTDQKIDYNLAFKKNPSKFYEEALNAPITKHKIQQQRPSLSPKNEKYDRKSTLGSQSSHSMSQKNLKTMNGLSTAKKHRRGDHEAYTIVSKQTTRPHNRINQKIKTKIESKLADQLGSQLTQKVLRALEDANLQDMINDIISQNSNLIDESNDSSQLAKSKAMSVKSLQIQNQLLDVCARDDYSQNSNTTNKRTSQNLVIPSHQRNESQAIQSTHDYVENKLSARSKVVVQQQQQSGHNTQRSGTSSKFYHSENNAHIEEEVRANKAY